MIPANLAAHRESLEAAGAQVAATADEARLATHELLRTHKAAGLSRREVEGRWARVCDRVWRHKGVSLLSTPDLCIADKDQIRLALDPLIGIEVHLVVTVESFSQQLYGGWLAELRAGRTTGWEKYAAPRAGPAARSQPRAPAGRAVLGRARPGRDPGPVGMDLPSRAAARRGRSRRERALAAVPRHRRVADESPTVVPPYADPAGVAVLRRVNRQLEAPLAAGSIELLTGVDRERVAMPVVPTPRCCRLVDRWADTLGRGPRPARRPPALVDAAVRAQPSCRPRRTSSARPWTPSPTLWPRTPGCAPGHLARARP